MITFLVICYDALDNIISTAQLFADYYVLYKPIKCQRNTFVKPTDLHSSSTLSLSLDMTIDIDKCVVMYMTMSGPLIMIA